MIDPKYDGTDLKFEFTDEVKAQMEADPKLAALVKDFMANMRQAQQLVNEGKYATTDEAMAAMGMPGGEVDLDDLE